MVSFKVLRQSSFLLLLTAALWLLFLYGAVLSSTALGVVFIAAWAVMTRGLLIRVRTRRRAWLALYLRQESIYSRLLRGGLLMSLVCAAIAAMLTLFLLVTLMRRDDGALWQALLLSTLLLFPVQQWLSTRFARHINPQFLAEFAWRTAALGLGLCLLGFLGWHGFHQQYPNLTEASLPQAVWYFVDNESARSPQLLVLLQLSAALDGFSQWLAQQLLPAPVSSFTQAGAWVLLFVRESLFVWSFLIMCRGMLALSDTGLNEMEKAQ